MHCPVPTRTSTSPPTACSAPPSTASTWTSSPPDPVHRASKALQIRRTAACAKTGEPAPSAMAPPATLPDPMRPSPAWMRKYGRLLAKVDDDAVPWSSPSDHGDMLGSRGQLQARRSVRMPSFAAPPRTPGSQERPRRLSRMMFSPPCWACAVSSLLAPCTGHDYSDYLRGRRPTHQLHHVLVRQDGAERVGHGAACAARDFNYAEFRDKPSCYPISNQPSRNR